MELTNNKLKEARRKADISLSELSKITGISKSTLQRYETGTTKKIPIEVIPILERAMNLPTGYLVGWNETMNKIPTKIKIPVLGRVAAGIPIEAVEEIIGYEEISFKEFNAEYDYFGLVIKGDSMKPRMQSGDVVIVRKQETAESGDIAVVLVNGNEATVKKIKIGTDGLMLIPLNQEYEVMMYNNEEIESLPVSIIGKVVELRAKF